MVHEGSVLFCVNNQRCSPDTCCRDQQLLPKARLSLASPTFNFLPLPRSKRLLVIPARPLIATRVLALLYVCCAAGL